MHARLLTLSALLLLSAGCSKIPLEAFRNREPESLLDVSSEVVTVDLTSEDSINEITNWMETDQPSRAELQCANGDALCAQAEDVFRLYSMDYQTTPAAQSQVNLIYERVTARDCDQHYVNNGNNPYNLYDPSYGCAVSANIVQMVSDKQQFVNPALLDFADAQKMVSMYNAYVTPTLAAQTQNQTPLVENISSQVGTN